MIRYDFHTLRFVSGSRSNTCQITRLLYRLLSHRRQAEIHITSVDKPPKQSEVQPAGPTFTPSSKVTLRWQRRWTQEQQNNNMTVLKHHTSVCSGVIRGKSEEEWKKSSVLKEQFWVFMIVLDIFYFYSMTVHTSESYFYCRSSSYNLYNRGTRLRQFTPGDKVLVLLPSSSSK